MESAKTPLNEPLEKDELALVRLESERLKRDLSIAERYWLLTVQPYIAGRKLRDAEFYVANSAHAILREAYKAVFDWNASKEGTIKPVPVPDFNDPQYHAPETLFADDLPPTQTLATIAASAMSQKASVTADEAVRFAHDLIIAAERYRLSLPKKPASEFNSSFDTAMSHVGISEIEASNNHDPGRLPLLPPLLVKKKGIENPGAGTQSRAAIKKELRAFLNGELKKSFLTEEEWNRERKQDALLEKHGLIQSGTGSRGTYQEWRIMQEQPLLDLKKGLIPVNVLCELRWKRFRENSERQSCTALTREQAKRR